MRFPWQKRTAADLAALTQDYAALKTCVASKATKPGSPEDIALYLAVCSVRREIALLPPPDPSRDAGNPEERAREERRRQLLQLLAEIEKRVNEENARPKKRYISPSTREADYAIYYDGLRRKIEERGTRDFPEQNGKKLYGELTMNITVDVNGRVVEADIVRHSTSRLLDRRALAIVRAAAPFGAFTADMRKQADQIVVTSRFRFTRDDGLETTLSNSVK